MSNPIKHVRETGEFVQISPVDYVRKPVDDEKHHYWMRVYEEKVRENTRLDMEINDLKWEITFLEEEIRQLRER